MSAQSNGPGDRPPAEVAPHQRALDDWPEGEPRPDDGLAPDRLCEAGLDEQPAGEDEEDRDEELQAAGWNAVLVYGTPFPETQPWTPPAEEDGWERAAARAESEPTGQFPVTDPMAIERDPTGEYEAVDISGVDAVDAGDTGEYEIVAVDQRRPRSPRQSINVGAVLGAAIGDAVGHPTEFIGSFDAIRSKYGPEGVSGFELYWERDGRRFAPYTDDTQMAEVVLRSLLESRERDEDLEAAMQRIGRGFVEWAEDPQGGHRAPGNACLAGCRALAGGAHWAEAGGVTAGGCGSVMRAYPFGLVFADDVRRAERWSVAHSKLTHRDPIALAASAAMAVGLAHVVAGQALDRVLSEMVAAACRYCARTASMIATAIHDARTGVAPETTLARLEGWAAHEAIAAAAYILARHPDDPRAAILEGANTPGDSDSLATLAGALVGARAGVETIPAEWVADVERSAELWALALRI